MKNRNAVKNPFKCNPLEKDLVQDLQNYSNMN